MKKESKGKSLIQKIFPWLKKPIVNPDINQLREDFEKEWANRTPEQIEERNRRLEEMHNSLYINDKGTNGVRVDHIYVANDGGPEQLRFVAANGKEFVLRVFTTHTGFTYIKLKLMPTNEWPETNT